MRTTNKSVLYSLWKLNRFLYLCERPTIVFYFICLSYGIVLFLLICLSWTQSLKWDTSCLDKIALAKYTLLVVLKENTGNFDKTKSLWWVFLFLKVKSIRQARHVSSQKKSWRTNIYKTPKKYMIIWEFGYNLGLTVLEIRRASRNIEKTCSDVELL